MKLQRDSSSPNRTIKAKLEHYLTKSLMPKASLESRSIHRHQKITQASGYDDTKDLFSLSHLQNQKRIVTERMFSAKINSEIKSIEIKKEQKKENLQDQMITPTNFSQVDSPSSILSTELAAKLTAESTYKLLDIPSWRVLYQHISMLTQPPAITYVFKQWGDKAHQMTIQLMEQQIQLIASTGRVYHASLDSLNQYQGRFSLELSSEQHNEYGYINAINTDDDKEDEKA